MTEIISKVKDPPPLCRPIVSVEEAPVDVIQVVKQAWSEEPERRPTIDDIFKQVYTHIYIMFSRFSVARWTLLSLSLPVTVQEHLQGKEDQHH